MWSKSCLALFPLLLDTWRVDNTASCAQTPSNLSLDCVPGPASGDTCLSVQAKLTLNKFHYTLYKNARSVPHLTSCPPTKGTPLPTSLHQGTSMGRRGRRGNSLVPKWPAMSMHKAIVASRSTSVTPNGPGRCEEGMAGSSGGPSTPSALLVTPWCLQP